MELDEPFLCGFNFFFFLRFYFIFRERGRKGEKHLCVRGKHPLVASYVSPLGTWPATQARALTGS